MNRPSLEMRVELLEQEVARMRQASSEKQDTRPWYEKIYGMFADDPYFMEAVEEGRKYRESLRPKPRKKTARKSKAKK